MIGFFGNWNSFLKVIDYFYFITDFFKYLQSTLPEVNDVPRQQGAAAGASTTVDYQSELHIMSRAARVLLSGIVCTIGPVSREPDFLVDMIAAGMNIARMNFSHGTHEYHGQTIANVRKAVEKFTSERGYDPSIAIALDTKGPEIRTGILEGDDGRKEVTLEMGAQIKITTDDQYKDKCSQNILWVDYKNITKVLSPGKRIFIDDGLISVIVRETGKIRLMMFCPI